MKVVNGLDRAVLVGASLEEIELSVLEPGGSLDIPFGSDEVITIGIDLQLDQRLGPVFTMSI